jgi:phytoene desaturase
MMLAPFQRLFADVGERLEDHLSLTQCEPSYRVFYSDGLCLDATSNREGMEQLIAGNFGPQEAAGFRRLMRDLESLYRDAIPNFVEKNFYSPMDFFGPRQLALVARHRLLSNLAKRIATYVSDPKLRMLFSFQTMYLGLSPYQAPWVYAVLTFMEYGEGIWYPKGGIAQIAQAIAALAEARGAQIRLNSEVAMIDGKTVILSSGEILVADAVICNADLPYAEKVLLPEKKTIERRLSCSALTMYLDYEGDLPGLRHHNVFFGQDFKSNLKQIFNRWELPHDPALYASVSARSDQRAPAGHENLYLLVPCPNLDRPWSDEDETLLREAVFARLSKEVGFDPSRIRGMKRISPADWATHLNLDKGAAFGLSHDLMQSAYFRPSNRSKTNPNLYFVGASTIPGNGMPMVLISAELAEQRLIKEAGA